MSLHNIPLPTLASVSLCTGGLGLFMALPLMALWRKRRSNMWLGLFVLSLSLLCIADFSRASGLTRRFPALFGVFNWPLATIGAFYYCYVRSMLGLGNGWRQAWLFLPLGGWGALLLNHAWHGPLGIPMAPLLLFFQLFACVCTMLVLVRLHQYRRQLRQQYASIEGRDFVWLSWLTLFMLGLLVLWLPATLLHGNWHWVQLIGRLGLLFVIGWYGMLQAEVFLPPASANGPAPDPIGAPACAAPAAGKYLRSGMTEAAQQLIGERLARRMAIECDYLDSDISLGDLAARIGTSPQLVSQYLNEVLGMNFFDYINGLRVTAVQEMMRNDAIADRALLDLAFAAGFNSRSTFNAAFKKITGMAPSQWRKGHAAMAEPFG